MSNPNNFMFLSEMGFTKRERHLLLKEFKNKKILYFTFSANKFSAVNSDIEKLIKLKKQKSPRRIRHIKIIYKHVDKNSIVIFYSNFIYEEFKCEILQKCFVC